MNTRRLALVAVLSFPLLAEVLPASAATEFYMRVEGQKQGKFEGAGGRARGRDWIPCVGFGGVAIQSPRDIASGQSSGKRQWRSVTITKDVDASSPKFARALQTNEILNGVEFEFVHATRNGEEQVYKTLRLGRAMIRSLRRVPGRGAREIEEISFTYQTIEFSGKGGRATAADDWQAMK